MTQHHLNEIKFISVGPIFNITTALSVLPRSLNKVSLLAISTRDILFPNVSIGSNYNRALSPAISLLSTVPQRAKRQILPPAHFVSHFWPVLMTVTQQTSTTEEQAQGCTGCMCTKPSQGTAWMGYCLHQREAQTCSTF